MLAVFKTLDDGRWMNLLRIHVLLRKFYFCHYITTCRLFSAGSGGSGLCARVRATIQQPGQATVRVNQQRWHNDANERHRETTHQRRLWGHNGGKLSRYLSKFVRIIALLFALLVHMYSMSQIALNTIMFLLAIQHWWNMFNTKL